MKLSGPCGQCGNDHHLQLSVDPEADLDAVVALTAGKAVDQSGTVAASADLVQTLVDAGVLACPAQPRRGNVLGSAHGGHVTT